MKYLVKAYGGPGFMTPGDTIDVLEQGIMPLFQALRKLETDHKILAGGLPIGERSLAFIIEVANNDEADQLLRDLPAWGALEWEVTPLQSFDLRETKDRRILEALKKLN